MTNVLPKGISALPIGDLPALHHLRLVPVGIVQGVSVGTIWTTERFDERKFWLNRGPGFRVGTPEAYFGSVYSKSTSSPFLTEGFRGSSSIDWNELAQSVAFDPNVARRNWFFVGPVSSYATAQSVKSYYLRRLLPTRKWGIESAGGAQLLSMIPGLTFETGEVTKAFNDHFMTSHETMRTEAKRLGAHGVIGVVESVRRLFGSPAVEFRLIGTAVRMEGEGSTDSEPWTTYLDAQRLIKLLESGRMPVSIASTFLSLVMVRSGWGKWLKSSGSANSHDLPEERILRELVYELARDRIHGVIGGDELHGVTVSGGPRDVGRSLSVNEAWLRGTHVRRFDRVASMAEPRLTLDLS